MVRSPKIWTAALFTAECTPKLGTRENQLIIPAACHLLVRDTTLTGDWYGYVQLSFCAELCVVRDFCPDNVGLQPSYGTIVDGKRHLGRTWFSICPWIFRWVFSLSCFPWQNTGVYINARDVSVTINKSV